MGKRAKPEEVIANLREIEIRLARGETAAAAARAVGVTEQSYYRWRKEYGGLQTNQDKLGLDRNKNYDRLINLCLNPNTYSKIMTFEDMNNLIQQAAAAEYEEGNSTLAEVYYLQALEFPDTYPVYCYGKFLFAQNRKKEADTYLQAAYDNDFAPAILFKLMQLLEDSNTENIYPPIPQDLDTKLRVAAGDGHLLAMQYVTEMKIKNSESFVQMLKHSWEHIKRAREIRRIKKNKDAPQESVWF